MKAVFISLLMLPVLAVSTWAFTIYDDRADAFVLIEEQEPSGDLKPVGTGLIVETIDCYTETFLVTRPEFLEGKDSIFINVVEIELYSYRGPFPLPLTNGAEKLWKSYKDSLVSIAALKTSFGGMIYGIDTAYMRPLSKVHLGDEALFLEFIPNDLHSIDEEYYPFARKAIVASEPIRNAYSAKRKWDLYDSTFIIDAKINPGSICSPVFSIANDTSQTITCIGMIQGPYKGLKGDQNLGVVTPIDAIIKVLDKFRKCR
jgi:hypothetical protein